MTDLTTVYEKGRLLVKDNLLCKNFAQFTKSIWKIFCINNSYQVL